MVNQKPRGTFPKEARMRGWGLEQDFVFSKRPQMLPDSLLSDRQYTARKLCWLLINIIVAWYLCSWVTSQNLCFLLNSVILRFTHIGLNVLFYSKCRIFQCHRSADSFSPLLLVINIIIEHHMKSYIFFNSQNIFQRPREDSDLWLWLNILKIVNWEILS